MSAKPLPTKKPDKRWFEQVLQEQGRSMRSLSLQMNLGGDGIHKRLSGIRTTTAEEASDLARHINQPLEEVMRRLGIATSAGSNAPIAVIGIVDAAGLISKAPPGLRVDRPRGAPAGASALRVQALSSPLDGWVAFYVPAAVLSAEAVGRLAVCEVASGERYMRILQRGYDRGRWNLHAIADGPALENVDVKWAAPVSFIAC